MGEASTASAVWTIEHRPTRRLSAGGEGAGEREDDGEEHSQSPREQQDKDRREEQSEQPVGTDSRQVTRSGNSCASKIPRCDVLTERHLPMLLAKRYTMQPATTAHISDSLEEGYRDGPALIADAAFRRTLMRTWQCRVVQGRQLPQRAERASA